MRKSVHSILFGLLSFTFTVSASAKQFEGSGTWTSDQERSGTYTAHVSVVEENGILKITDTYVWNGITKVMKYSIQKKAKTFFDVHNENNDYIGSGYCVPISANTTEKVCHADTVGVDSYSETTVQVTDTKLYRVGSMSVVSTNEKIVWNDILQ